MTDHPSDPRRLHEAQDAPAELRSWLEHAHDDAASDALVEQLLRGVEQRMGPAAPASTSLPQNSLLARVARHPTKLLLAVAVLGLGAGAGSWYLARYSDEGAANPLPTVSPPHAPTIEPMVSPQEQLPSLAPEDPDVQGRPQARVGATRLRSRASGSKLDHQGARAEALAAGPAVTGEEYALLKTARQVLDDHPARALELTDEHLRRFPAGMLAQEREAIAVEALMQMGKEGTARVRAKAFLSTHPSSPYRNRIEKAVVGRVGEGANPR